MTQFTPNVTGDGSNLTVTTPASGSRTLVVIADSTMVRVKSVMDFIALTTAPNQVWLETWDGTVATSIAEGLFALVSTPPASGVVIDGGVNFITAGNSHYRRVVSGAYDPAWFGAVGDGTSRQLETRFSTLEEAQVFFPTVYSLKQECDWVGNQVAALTGQGIASPARNYIMANADVASDDNPLIWISGTTFGDYTNSTLDFSALKAVTTVEEHIDDPTFATGNASGKFVNASIYSPAQITDVVFEKGKAVYTDQPNATQITGSVENGVLTVTAITGLPALAVGDTLYDSQWKLGTDTTITSFGTGTGGVGTYNLSNTTAVIAATDNNNMSTATGHWNQFGQQLTLKKGAYIFEIEYSCTLGGSFAMLNSQPGSIGMGVNGGSPGSGSSTWVTQGLGQTFTTLSSTPLTGSMSVPIYVPEDSTQWVVVSCSGYINVDFTKFSVTKLNRNTAILSTRDGATLHYPLPIPTQGFTLTGPGADSGITGIWYNSYENTDGTIMNLGKGSVTNFGIGFNFGSGAYLSEYWDFGMGGNGICIQFLPGSINAGENFRFYGGGYGNSNAIINNPGGAEFTFYGSSLDYSNQCIINNTGRIEVHGCHMEMNGPSEEGKSLFHCKGSGTITCFGGMFLGAGSYQNYKAPAIHLEDNMSSMTFHDTQLYNLSGPGNVALLGPGQLKIRSSDNTGNSNVGTYNNWTSDPLGLAGFFIPQSGSVVALNGGVGLIGGLYSDGIAGVDQWTSEGASAAISTDYTYNGYPASLKVSIRGNNQNDRLIFCIPIEKYQSGTISIATLFPYDLTTGAVSTNDTIPSDGSNMADMYFRTYFVQIIGSDQFGRPNFGAANLFCGENDIRMPSAGYTKWLVNGTGPGYLGNPQAADPLKTDYVGSGAPAFATHIALILDTESMPPCTFYIGAITANLY